MSNNSSLLCVVTLVLLSRSTYNEFMPRKKQILGNTLPHVVSIVAEIDSAQFSWIIENLKTVQKETPIVITLHIPLISAGKQMLEGGTAALSPRLALENSHEILNLFKDHNLRIVLQGHLHIVEEIIYKNTHFITAGAVSARWWKGPNAGFPEGFAVIDVNENDFQWNYETFGWKTVYKSE